MLWLLYISRSFSLGLLKVNTSGLGLEHSLKFCCLELVAVFAMIFAARELNVGTSMNFLFTEDFSVN